MNQNPVNLILALLLAALLSACATAQNSYDPIQPVNRVTDGFNDGVDRVTLKPVAQGYTAIVPKPARTAVSNFYDNATYLNTVLNDFLQGKGGQGFMDLFRFLINSTLGIGGLVDVATPMGLDRHEEDFGQTLAVWGVDKGAYLVIPLLGPNSVRDAPDFITSTATDPLFWASLVVAPVVTIPITLLKYIDKRAQLLDASDMRDELALDPYIFTREAWRQNREYNIHDGNPPKPQQSDDEEWEEDEWGSNDQKGGGDGWEEDEFDSAPDDPQPKTRISMQGASTDTSAMQATADTSDLMAVEVEAAAQAEKVAATATADQLFMINLISFESEVGAAAEQGRLSREGVNARINRVDVNGRVWYRLVSSDYFNINDARAKLKEIKQHPGLASAWLEPAPSK
ncbi:hypothetical protein F3F96_03395 [Mariprofundus sp. NF]|uniref:MlaA family lipoprotein n=1 Tax=Mariprofundus sp. NF TaxID=2608716 RepID=UPI0015A04FF8|nr:MlaA family lipoprotein [Mariprofundus sp. NF]NWF38182.1 hypothetical protein [Mariprofundus sp. NF]